jgi:hypothetical protein
MYEGHLERSIGREQKKEIEKGRAVRKMCCSNLKMFNSNGTGEGLN